MQVVYSSRHLAHDIDTETFMGVAIPANEVAERAERIRAALEADGGFGFVDPTPHGEAPITAVHDEHLVRFLESAWSEVRSQAIPRAFLSADTYPNRAMFDYEPLGVLAGIEAPVTALVGADDETRSRARALAAVSAAREAVGRSPIRAISFGHDGHNLMRYRPREVAAAILAADRPPTGGG